MANVTIVFHTGPLLHLSLNTTCAVVYKLNKNENYTTRPPFKTSNGPGKISVKCRADLLSLTHENEVYLHSVGRIPKHSRRRWDKHIRTSCQNMNLYNCMTFFTFVVIFRVSFITALKIKFMQGSNHKEHCKINCIISHAQNTTALHPNVCFSGKLLVRHKQGGFGFLPSANNS